MLRITIISFSLINFFSISNVFPVTKYVTIESNALVFKYPTMNNTSN